MARDLTSCEALLTQVARDAVRYMEGIADRRVTPAPDDVRRLDELAGELPAEGAGDLELLRLLADVGGPATMGTTGGRYFGFVNGGALPAAIAASWLTTTWDQNACLAIMSPTSARLEEIAGGWLIDLLGLPPESAFALVSGATMANCVGIAAARHRLLARRGWDVEAQGLNGAPRLRVVVGDEVHVSVLKALSVLGMGRDTVERVPVDDQGRLVASALPELDELTLVCAQAGNVNTGAFDPFAEICGRARAAGAWVHVDGAFGLWAAAAPARRRLTQGVELADSWATDAHKWLNATYDCGVAVVRDGAAARAAMSSTAAYLTETSVREPSHYTPELSRRARGVELWALLRSLGRSGLAVMIEDNCRCATLFAEGLRARGLEVLNRVELNQVLVSFGDAARTLEIVARVQAEGTFWAGSTVWQGRTAMRISVSDWRTDDADIARCLEALDRILAG